MDNRRFAELAGIEPTYAHTKINCPNCGYLCTGKSIFCTPPIPVYPDFSNPLEVLRVMDEKGVLCSFLALYFVHPIDLATAMVRRPGSILSMAIEWMEGRP